MDNTDAREAERTANKNILREFDSEAQDRADGTIQGEELADKLAAKNAAVARLADMAKEDELLASQDGQLNSPNGASSMTIRLGDALFRDVHSSPMEFKYRGRDLRLTADGPFIIKILENDVLLAFLTPYSESESGILRPGSPKNILAPLYRTLNEALDSLRLD